MVSMGKLGFCFASERSKPEEIDKVVIRLLQKR